MARSYTENVISISVRKTAIHCSGIRKWKFLVYFKDNGLLNGNIWQCSNGSRKEKAIGTGGGDFNFEDSNLN